MRLLPSHSFCSHSRPDEDVVPHHSGQGGEGKARRRGQTRLLVENLKTIQLED